MIITRNALIMVEIRVQHVKYTIYTCIFITLASVMYLTSWVFD